VTDNPSLAEVAELQREQIKKSRAKYDNHLHAERFIEKYLADVWRRQLRIDNALPIVDQLKIPKGPCKVLHLFGHGVYGIHMKSGTPPIRAFVPMQYADSEFSLKKTLRAVTKSVVADAIGCTVKALDGYIKWLRGGAGEASRRFVNEKLGVAMFCPEGIMVDLARTTQVMFPFAYEEYSYAQNAAENLRLATAPTIHTQIEWCRDAKREMVGSVPVSKPAENVNAEAKAG
jgi:hypothetical protein